MLPAYVGRGVARGGGGRRGVAKTRVRVIYSQYARTQFGSCLPGVPRPNKNNMHIAYKDPCMHASWVDMA
jgi:hypothetical protein